VAFDVKKASRDEIEALLLRYNHLLNRFNLSIFEVEQKMKTPAFNRNAAPRERHVRADKGKVITPKG
jgi:hypothetical protein